MSLSKQTPLSNWHIQMVILQNGHWDDSSFYPLQFAYKETLFLISFIISCLKKKVRKFSTLTNHPNQKLILFKNCTKYQPIKKTRFCWMKQAKKKKTRTDYPQPCCLEELLKSSVKIELTFITDFGWKNYSLNSYSPPTHTDAPTTHHSFQTKLQRLSSSLLPRGGAMKEREKRK